jgi:predicted AAA+ superfamily ATPase
MVGVKSAHTVQKYLGYLVEAFLIFEVKGFSFKYREQVKANKKIYAIDNGYIGSRAFRFTPNLGVLYENMVAVELKRRELKGDLEFYYYRNAQGYEVDFVVKEGLEITRLIQVSLDVSDPRTRQREVRSLLHASRELNCRNLIIITGDYESTETVEWYDLKGDVRFIPLPSWLHTFKD